MMDLSEKTLKTAAILLCAALLGCGKSAEKSPRVTAEEIKLTPATAKDVLAAVKNSGADAVLVNVWATWCIPCREEFPDLMRLHQKYRNRGLKLVLVSADFDSELPHVKEFLAKQGVDFPSFIKNETDMAFINGMSEQWSGALPATFVYDKRGDLRHFWEGKATFSVFERKILDVLEP
jgi:thiol-disulfide isomerase/thioredoxin